MGKVVLVTGVARRLGGRFVRRILREPGVERVIGVDAVPPEHHLAGAHFARADIRHPRIARVLAEHSVDTVVHLDVTGSALAAAADIPSAFGGGGPSGWRRGQGRSAVKETNVIGTMQLLGACQKAPSVRRLVVKSTTSVYGAASRDPAVFTETMQPKALPTGSVQPNRFGKWKQRKYPPGFKTRRISASEAYSSPPVSRTCSRTPMLNTY